MLAGGLQHGCMGPDGTDHAGGGFRQEWVARARCVLMRPTVQVSGQPPRRQEAVWAPCRMCFLRILLFCVRSSKAQTRGVLLRGLERKARLNLWQFSTPPVRAKGSERVWPQVTHFGLFRLSFELAPFRSKIFWILAYCSISFVFGN